MQIVQVLRSSRTLAAIATASVLAACGMSGSKTGAAAQTQQSGPDTKAVHSGGDAIDPDLVTAVSSAHSNTPIGMKFDLAARPVIGAPLKVVVALIPAAGAGISHIHASFQPGDGLLLQSDRTLDIADPVAGAVIERELSVVPQQSGVLSIAATVMVDMDGGSLARSYAIPLIVRDNP